MPARGHAAAAHPTRPEAVAFARRPGTFAVVIDCVTGVQKAVLSSPSGRHFYGHGAFSSDGSLLYTTENDFEAGQGRIGVWDARHGYARVAEWASGGIGPHDIKRLPNTETLVVANGGIDTHPDTGRTKLNIATMKPNLTYIENGRVKEIAVLPPDMHKNSIRHLAVRQNGDVAFGMQWQGDGPAAALVGIHSLGKQITLMKLAAQEAHDMDGYVGSVAYSQDGSSVAATSPRGSLLQIYDTGSLHLSDTFKIPDVSGVTTMDNHFLVSSGEGDIKLINAQTEVTPNRSNLAWDNHLISV